MAFEFGLMVYLGFQGRADRARPAPLPEGPSPLRRPSRQRHGNARLGEPRPRKTGALTPQQPQQPVGPRVVRRLPIHALETEDVFRVIREAGQSPH